MTFPKKGFPYSLGKFYEGLEQALTDLGEILAEIDDNVDDVKTVTDLLPDNGALTSIAKEATLGVPTDTNISTDISNVQSKADTIDGKADTIDGNVDSIKTTVEGTDTTANTIDGKADTIDDKLGANTDLWGNSTKTVLAYNNAVYKHIHNPSRITPDDCTTIDVTTSATADTFGDFVTIIAATTKAIDFHWANIVEVTSTGAYIIEFWTLDAEDAEETYLGVISPNRLDNFTKASEMTVQIPVVPTGSKIACKAKKSGAGAGTVKFNLIYHDYE